MVSETYRTSIGSELADGVVSSARTSLGDTLRSVVYFTPSAFDVLYVRQDLYDTAEAARDAKGDLVDMEQVGFAEVPLRSAIAERTERATIGPYRFTVRFHDDGFVVRVLRADAGVLLTVDSMEASAIEDAVGAIERLLLAE